ncbi:MAG: ArsR family transcriptional regulator, partial [Lachnospiraceae bacterium]|nr:ArsR family transcriptional regulator [Lachnospiraceae bacterium]
MALQESGEMYLETIYVLSQSSSTVRAIDIGEELGYTKPSVSRALGVLRNEGLIKKDSDGYI